MENKDQFSGPFLIYQHTKIFFGKIRIIIYLKNDKKNIVLEDGYFRYEGEKQIYAYDEDGSNKFNELKNQFGEVTVKNKDTHYFPSYKDFIKKISE